MSETTDQVIDEKIDPRTGEVYHVATRAGRKCIHPHGDEVVTKQEFKDDANINVIMARYIKTGQVPVHNREAFYGDFEDVDSYLETRSRLAHFETLFNTLPSEIRDQFGSRPEQLMEAFADGNPELLEKLGLIEPEQAETTPAESPAESAPAEQESNATS